MTSSGRVSPWYSWWAIFALTVGVLVHILGFVIFEITTETSFQVQIPEAYVGFPRMDSSANSKVLVEQALLYDSEPLFLPTNWNANPERVGRFLVVEDASPFEPFAEARMIELVTLDTYQDVSLPLETLSVPEEVLSLENPQLFAEFGQMSLPQQESSTAGLSVAIYDLSDGTVFYEAHHPAAIENLLPNWELWTVIELLVIVDASGIVGEPLVAESSGKLEIDQFLQQFCLTELGRHLTQTGYFRIYVGP